jgi:hypothetical protein
MDGVLCALADEVLVGEPQVVRGDTPTVIVKVGSSSVFVDDVGHLPRWERERVAGLQRKQVAVAAMRRGPDIYHQREWLRALEEGGHVAIGELEEMQWCIDVRLASAGREDWLADVKRSDSGRWTDFVERVWNSAASAEDVELKAIQLVLNVPDDALAGDIVAWWVTRTQGGKAAGIRLRETDAPAMVVLGGGWAVDVGVFSLRVAAKVMNLPPGTLNPISLGTEDGKKRLWMALQAFRAARPPDATR